MRSAQSGSRPPKSFFLFLCRSTKPGANCAPTVTLMAGDEMAAAVRSFATGLRKLSRSRQGNRRVHEMTTVILISLVISVVEAGKVRHSGDQPSGRAISLNTLCPTNATRLSFLPHLAKNLPLSGNNRGMHVDLTRFWTLNQPGRGRIAKDVHSIAIGVNWLCVGWAVRFWCRSDGPSIALVGAMSRQHMSVMCGLF